MNCQFLIQYWKNWEALAICPSRQNLTPRCRQHIPQSTKNNCWMQFHCRQKEWTSKYPLFPTLQFTSHESLSPSIFLIFLLHTVEHPCFWLPLNFWTCQSWAVLNHEFLGNVLKHLTDQSDIFTKLMRQSFKMLW